MIPIDHPAKTVKELVEWAKKNPDKANYASTSPAFITATELLKLKSGMPGDHDPLQEQQRDDPERHAGPDPAGDLRRPAGDADDQGRQGASAIAVTGSERSEELPDVPSMAEAGFPEVNTKLWSGFFVGADTPPPIVAKLEAALRKAITDPDVASKLKAMAVTPGGTSSAEFRTMIDEDIESYVAVIKAANLKFDN